MSDTATPSPVSPESAPAAAPAPSASTLPAVADISLFAPLRNRVFRGFWLSNLASDLGTWMQDIAAAWLMTSLAASALQVAMVQAATSLPVFLLALPAGALADIVDRRRLLMATQTWMMACAALLGICTLFKWTTSPLLLGFTFLLGLGAAMNRPAWQAMPPEMVHRDQLPSAVSLSSIEFNLARAFGPALGGIVLASFGAGFAFLLNAASFLAVVLFLVRLRRPQRKTLATGERMLQAIRSGLRYTRYSPNLRSILIHATGFTLFASALWALIPQYVRRSLGGGPLAYGSLLGLFGVGAVLAAVSLSRLRSKYTLHEVVTAGSGLFATAMLGLGFSKHMLPAAASLFLAGAAWMAVMWALNSSAYLVVPAWVRSRALSVYILVFYGCMAGGSVVWGSLADRTSIAVVFWCAAAGVALGIAPLYRYRLASGEGLNLSPSLHWPTPMPATPLGEEQGPVMVYIEYRIAPEDAAAFKDAMDFVRRSRGRTGASNWGLFQDVAEPDRFVEFFLVESWAEHLRQHERVTITDRELEARARALHRGSEPPRETHLLAASAPNLF